MDQPTTRGDRGLFSSRMVACLDAYVSAHGIGRVFCNMTPFKVETMPGGPLTDTCVPGIAYVSFERLSFDAPLGEVLSVMPDLAVKFIEGNEVYTAVINRTNELLDSGVQQVWHVLLKWQEMRVFSQFDRAGQVLTVADTLDGGNLLPGFSVPLESIFDYANTQLHVEVLRRLLESE